MKPKKRLLLPPKDDLMWKVYSKYKKVVDFLAIMVFWLVVCIISLTVSIIRPYCVQHPYKELLCVAFIVTVVMFTRLVLFPCLYQKGKRTLFWVLLALLLSLSAGAELWLVTSDIAVTNPHVMEISGYMSTLFFSVLLRNTGILLCRLIPLWIPKRDPNSLSKQESICVSNEGKGTFDTIDDNKDPSMTTFETTPVLQSAMSVQDLDLNQKSVLDIIMNHPGCNTQYIVSHSPYEISQRSIERCVNILKKKRLIEHIGSLKTGGYWVIDTADSQDNEVRKDCVSDENVLG